MQVGKNIRRLRKEQGLDQGELANLVGITQPYLSQLENGERDPSMSLLRKICEELDLSLPELFLLSMDEEDVQPDRREAFEELRPHLERFLIDQVSGESTNSEFASE
jgi:transcriptional regulator with XRE-family HTH domain